MSGTWVRALARGALAGLAGTTAMSVVMLAARKTGRMGKLPPERVTEAGLRVLRVQASERSENALSTAAHLGYGATVGALFAAAGSTVRLPLPAPVTGALYGLAVWAAGYAGWMPALGIMPPPHRDRPDRQTAMVLSHLVYGAVLGALVGKASPVARAFRP